MCRGVTSGAPACASGAYPRINLVFSVGLPQNDALHHAGAPMERPYACVPKLGLVGAYPAINWFVYGSMIVGASPVVRLHAPVGHTPK